MFFQKKSSVWSISLVTMLFAFAIVFSTNKKANAEDTKPVKPFEITINSLISAPYGHWPILPHFIVTNTLDNDRFVTVTTTVGGLAWGGSVTNYTFPDTGGYGWTISNMTGSSDSMTITWNGWINGHSSVKVGFQTDTQSWTNPYTVEFLKMQVENKILTSTMTLTPGPGLSGTMSADRIENQAAPIYWLNLTTTSIYMGQFSAPKPFTSNCNLIGLPSGYYGNYARTFEYHQWSFEYVSGGPICEIDANIITNAGNYDSIIPVSTTFTAPKSQVIVDGGLMLSTGNVYSGTVTGKYEIGIGVYNNSPYTQTLVNFSFSDQPNHILPTEFDCVIGQLPNQNITVILDGNSSGSFRGHIYGLRPWSGIRVICQEVPLLPSQYTYTFIATDQYGVPSFGHYVTVNVSLKQVFFPLVMH